MHCVCRHAGDAAYYCSRHQSGCLLTAEQAQKWRYAEQTASELLTRMWRDVATASVETSSFWTAIEVCVFSSTAHNCAQECSLGMSAQAAASGLKQECESTCWFA